MSKRMEYRAYPNEKEGTKYIVKDSEGRSNISEGDVVTLERNDGTSIPYFRLLSGDITDIRWNRLSKITKHVIGGDIL